MQHAVDLDSRLQSERPDPALRRRASAQLGLLSTGQAPELSQRTRYRRVSNEEWVREGLRVLRHTAAPRTDRQRALTAVLDAGDAALLSHFSAAALWGLPGFALCPTHVVTPRRSHPVHRPVGTVHRMRALAPAHGTVLDGLPLVRPELLALQLCGSVAPERAARLFDRLWSMRLLSGRSTRRVLDDVSASGVRGVVVLRTILDERGDNYVPPASGLEGRFAQIIREANLPAMERQVDLGDDSWCGRVDFVDTTHKIVVEVDSERFHTALTDVKADRERAARLRRAGFQVVRVTDAQVFHRPRQVVDAVRRAWLSGST